MVSCNVGGRKGVGSKKKRKRKDGCCPMGLLVKWEIGARVQIYTVCNIKVLVRGQHRCGYLGNFVIAIVSYPLSTSVFEQGTYLTTAILKLFSRTMKL